MVTATNLSDRAAQLMENPHEEMGEKLVDGQNQTPMPGLTGQLAASETSLLIRIWQAIQTALQTFAAWILSAACCTPRAIDGLVPGRSEQRTSPNQDLPWGRFQGRLNWRQMAPEGVSENCALELLIKLWDHLKAGGRKEGLSNLIDPSILSAAAKPQQEPIRTRFPRVQEIHYPMNLANIERLARLEFNAFANQGQKMRGAVVKIGEDSHALLVNARIRGEISYYHFNPQGNPAYLQTFDNRQEWIEYLDREIEINGQLWAMRAYDIGDEVDG